MNNKISTFINKTDYYSFRSISIVFNNSELSILRKGNRVPGLFLMANILNRDPNSTMVRNPFILYEDIKDVKFAELKICGDQSFLHITLDSIEDYCYIIKMIQKSDKEKEIKPFRTRSFYPFSIINNMIRLQGPTKLYNNNVCRGSISNFEFKKIARILRRNPKTYSYITLVIENDSEDNKRYSLNYLCNNDEINKIIAEREKNEE